MLVGLFQLQKTLQNGSGQERETVSDWNAAIVRQLERQSAEICLKMCAIEYV